MANHGYVKTIKYDLRDCATLGTLWCDIYRNDELFLRELPRELGEAFIKYPFMFPGAFIDAPRLRTFWIERDEYIRDSNGIESPLDELKSCGIVHAAPFCLKNEQIEKLEKCAAKSNVTVKQYLTEIIQSHLNKLGIIDAPAQEDEQDKNHKGNSKNQKVV